MTTNPHNWPESRQRAWRYEQWRQRSLRPHRINPSQFHGLCYDPEHFHIELEPFTGNGRFR